MGEWTATVTSGVGKATGEFHERGTPDRWAEFGYVPVPGTLNLDCPKDTRVAIRRLPTSVRWDGPERLVDHAKVFYPVTIDGFPCHVRVLATHIEAVAPVKLRDRLGLSEGQTVTVSAAKVSVAVMAHQKREAWVPALVDSIDADVQVVWDRHNDRWDTGRRSLLAYDPEASHHLVVQDDAIVCRDLVAGLTRAVAYSQHRPVALYMGTVRPAQSLVTKANEEASRKGASWIEMEGPWWGVGILVPTGDIDEIVAFGDKRTDVQNYDLKVSRYYASRQIMCWYPRPSLVEHRHGRDGDGKPANESLVTGRTGIDRQAWRFIGADESALTVDWSGPVVDAARAGKVTFRHARTGEVKVLEAHSNEARRHRRHRLWEQQEES